MVQANQTELLGNKSFLTVGVERPESLMPVGGGVRLACSLHFRREYLGLDEAFLFPLLTGEGQGEVSSRVEKFKSLEEVKTNPSLFTPHSSRHCLEVYKFSSLGEVNVVEELNSGKVEKELKIYSTFPQENDFPSVHNQPSLQFAKTYPSLLTPHSSLKFLITWSPRHLRHASHLTLHQDITHLTSLIREGKLPPSLDEGYQAGKFFYNKYCNHPQFFI